MSTWSTYRWSSAAGSGRNAGAAYKRKDWLPINELGGAMTRRPAGLTEEQVAQRVRRGVSTHFRTEVETLLRMQGLTSSCPARRTCWPVPSWTNRSACPAAAELLQLSLKEVCADFNTMLCHDWRPPRPRAAVRGAKDGQREGCVGQTVAATAHDRASCGGFPGP